MFLVALKEPKFRARTSYCRLNNYHFFLPSFQHFQSLCFFTYKVQRFHGRQVLIGPILLKCILKDFLTMDISAYDKLFHWYMATSTHPKKQTTNQTNKNQSNSCRCLPSLCLTIADEACEPCSPGMKCYFSNMFLEKLYSLRIHYTDHLLFISFPYRIFCFCLNMGDFFRMVGPEIKETCFRIHPSVLIKSLSPFTQQARQGGSFLRQSWKINR